MLRRAKELGLIRTYGMDMLLAQAKELFNFCYGIVPSEEDVEASRQSLRGYVGPWGE